MLNSNVCKQFLTPGFEKLEVLTAIKKKVYTTPSAGHHLLPGKLRQLPIKLLISAANIRGLSLKDEQHSPKVERALFRKKGARKGANIFIL